MPAPPGQLWFSNSTFDIGGDGSLGPLQHWFVVAEDAAQTANRWRIGDWVGVVDMVAIRGSQGAPQHLVNSHEQFTAGFATEHFVNEPVDCLVAKRVDIFQAHLLLVKSFSQ